MGNMNRVAALAALLAAGMAGGGAVAVQPRINDAPIGYMPTPSSGGSIGKGKGKRPRHSSARFVAHDKRAARKARNRAR